MNVEAGEGDNVNMKRRKNYMKKNQISIKGSTIQEDVSLQIC